MDDRERYAVVSCHVERPLDDETWKRFSELHARRPGGFRIAALMRPPDEAAGEDLELWLARAREAADRGPLGHHTHWGGPAQARPRGGDPAARVRREGQWLRDVGLAPTVFCGGGWYFDATVAETVAELGYADCTGRAARPRYLEPSEPWLQAREPCWLELGRRRLLELPTTHSLGDLTRAVFGLDSLGRYVHAYFHDGDLLDSRRRGALRAALTVLARRRTPSDIDTVAARSSKFPIRAP